MNAKTHNSGRKRVPNWMSIRLEEGQAEKIEAIAVRNNMPRSAVMRLLINRGIQAAREDARARAAAR